MNQKLKHERFTHTCVVTVAALGLVLSACKPSSAGKTDSGGTFVAQSSSAVQSEIKVIYPTDLTPIPASSTFICGSIPPDKHLLCDGAEVKSNAKGYFAHVVQIHHGLNKFKLSEKENPQEAREISIMRETPRPSISAGTLKLAVETAQPNEDCGYAVGDIIELSVHATPGSNVKVQLGKRAVELAPSAVLRQKARSKKQVRGHVRSAANVNVGLDAAYGKMYQRLPSSAPDLYVGFYKVAADDNWQNVVPKFFINNNGKTASAPSQGLVTTIHQPFIAQTKHDRTVVRTGPGASRLTPLPQGVRLLADGWKGNEVRCVYSSTQHTWIPKDDLVFEARPGETGALPQSQIRTINTTSDNYGDDIIVPLNQRLPFILEQHLKPAQLVMKIFGGNANTDWVSPSVPSGIDTELVDNVTWKQVADNTYELTAHLKHDRQWGFYADYQNSDLHLHVKHAPKIKPTADGRLDGLVICLDPGHGGSELGAIGCGGKREEEINLGIALKLEALLKQRGADVIMTRTDDRLVSLDDRVVMAEKNHVDILLSIHNNSLPDGRDPWNEHGTSSYWYHPQAIELARTLKVSEMQAIHFVDLATRWQNLALTRPSAMLAVLYEVGFMINPDEYAFLEDDAGQEKCAEGLANGLYTYLKPHQVAAPPDGN